MELEQIEIVARAQAVLRQPRRARIATQLGAGIVSSDELEPARDGGRRVFGAPKQTDTSLVLAVALRCCAAQVVAAGTGMRIDEAQRCVLDRETCKQRREHD